MNNSTNYVSKNRVIEDVETQGETLMTKLSSAMTDVGYPLLTTVMVFIFVLSVSPLTFGMLDAGIRF